MLPEFHDKSEAQFKRLLIISLAAYFVFSLFVLLVPYKPVLQKISIHPQRTVRLTEIPLKAPVPATIPASLREKQRLLEEQKRREAERKKAEEAKKATEEKKKLEEAKKLAEERKRQEEAKRLEEEKRRAEQERKRAEEEQRLAKERNREVAKNAGLLKAMQGRGKSVDNLINTEEIGNVLSQSQVKPAKPQQGGAAAGAITGAQRPALKGSGGIGNVAPSVAKAQPGNLSGSRTISGRDVVPPGKEGTSPFEKSTLRQTRSQESIKEVIKSHRGSLDFAYRKALRSDPTLKGIINIEFTISPDGTVISARLVSGTVNDPSFVEDVLKRVKTWKFPAYPDSGNTVVTYPIEFSPV